MQLYPKPKSIQMFEGSRSLTNNIKLVVDKDDEELAKKLNVKSRVKKAITVRDDQKPDMNVFVIQRNDIPEEGYILQWTEAGLLLEFGTLKGLHYALVSFEQLVLVNGTHWNYFRIEDEPTLPVRGYMLDIGRNRIPKLETLFLVIDQMAKLKMNHLQLHMEGFCFQYKKYEHLFPESTPITAEEFRQLDTYANERFIDLVPNQNCFGHMAGWLEKKEFRGLAEHPNGMEVGLPFTIPPGTLNPLDKGSINLVTDLFDELLPNFTSSYVNFNLDEPFGLGKGASKERADTIGIGSLYMEFANKIFEIARKHNKKILMWGDVVTNHPETIDQLPEDVTVLDWNYDAPISFEKNAAFFHEHQIPFYECCGTSSWSSISGRTDNMLGNISDAAINAEKYLAKGLIVTDWGDSGHWQVLPISYPGMVYAAGVSWQVENNLYQYIEVEDYISKAIYQDKSGEIGNFLMELGRYYLLENSSVENATYTNNLLNHGLSSRATLEKKMEGLMKILTQFGARNDKFNLDYDFNSMIVWLNDRKVQLDKINIGVNNGEPTKEELRNTIRLIEQGVGLHQLIFLMDGNEDQELGILKELTTNLQVTIDTFNALWLTRSRAGGLEKSNAALYKLLEQYKGRISELE